MGKKYIKAVGRFFEPSEGESDRMAAGEDKATASRADLLTKALFWAYAHRPRTPKGADEQFSHCPIL